MELSCSRYGYASSAKYPKWLQRRGVQDAAPLWSGVDSWGKGYAAQRVVAPAFDANTKNPARGGVLVNLGGLEDDLGRSDFRPKLGLDQFSIKGFSISRVSGAKHTNDDVTAGLRYRVAASRY